MAPYKVNMPGQHQDVSCALKCTNTTAVDSQEHQLECSELSTVRDVIENLHGKVQYSDIFGDTMSQRRITVLFAKLSET